MNKNQIKYMNIAKALGIILIVAGHSFTENTNSQVRSFVYLFHVPFFFIISGYFFNEKYINTPYNLLKRRIKSLWTPFFLWSTAFIVLHNVFFTFYIYSPQVTFRGSSIPSYPIETMAKKIVWLFYFKGSEQLLGGFWFISCLFFAVIFFFGIVYIAKLINHNTCIHLFAISSFLIGNLLVCYDVHIPLIRHNIKLYLVATFLYYLGWLYKKYEKKMRFTVSYATICLLILIFINQINNIKIISIDSTLGSFDKSIPFLILTPTIGTYLILYISKQIEKYSFSNIFKYIGRRTITILALHFLCFKLVNLIIVLKKNQSLSQIANFPVMPNSENYFVAYLIVGVLLPVLLHTFFITFWVKCRSYMKPAQQIN